MSTGESPRTSALATLALLSVTATWGSTFFLIKDLLDRVPVADFLAVRFTIAAVALLLVAPRAVARLSPLARRRGAALGLVYGAAQLLQTAGLGHTSASVSGFVTGMYVVMTPLFAALLFRTRVDRTAWIAVGLATAGLALLSLQGLSVGLGESLTLASAALYALHIVGLGACQFQRMRWACPSCRSPSSRPSAGRGQSRAGSCSRQADPTGPRCSTWRWSRARSHSSRRPGRRHTCPRRAPPSS
jgi:threonine/homoserine efflux transporter RhtA